MKTMYLGALCAAFAMSAVAPMSAAERRAGRYMRGPDDHPSLGGGDVRDLIKQVSNQLTETSDKLSKKAEDALKEVKDLGGLQQTTKDEVDKLAVEQTGLKGKLDELNAKMLEVEQRSVRRGGERGEDVASVGNQLIQAEGLKEFATNVQGGKRFNVPVKNALMSSDIGAGIIEPTRLPGIDASPKQRLFIRDLIAPGRTGSPVIFWVQQTGFTNNARVVTEGQTKPTSNIAFTPKMTPVATIAHLFKASKQIMDDFAQLQSTVDAEMRYGLKYAEEREVLFGDGDGGNLHGIVPQAEDFDPAFTVTMQTHIDDLRLAMLQSQLARLPADGIVMHFIDWAKIELTKDANGVYVLSNPLRLSGPTLWGLPIVATEVPEFEGEFLTGPFKTGAQLFDREDANVIISTENADDFEKNMITVRCEERVGLAVKRPEGFITGAFTTQTATA
jgi:HK97 family phage major capsid protein